ncbi:hypothetical protein [Phnomibacter ginsenosidimutans]|uniref:Uncharacterized protein n=1 Tax=Phnomibacter ginsenosidimutans TaxID=2676868 RepID=A0A6I6G607_9BACT|nr:hypothetical protein [Phnomibacter ginsenosidimutans]QGW26853.1 hypothetical protein GLV81_00935 [Phnomibacter ginsenosidimutans]
MGKALTRLVAILVYHFSSMHLWQKAISTNEKMRLKSFTQLTSAFYRLKPVPMRDNVVQRLASPTSLFSISYCLFLIPTSLYQASGTGAGFTGPPFNQLFCHYSKSVILATFLPALPKTLFFNALNHFNNTSGCHVLKKIWYYVLHGTD